MKARLVSTLAVVASSMSLIVGLAGCGSSTSTATPAATAASASGSYAVDANTLVFGVVPDSVSTQTNYQPLMDYIAKKSGKKVQYHESTDYAALIEASIAGKIDVASFSGFTYVTAKNNGAKLTPISSIVTVKGQEPGYYSMAIVPKSSTITSLAQFKGKKVCFVDPSSTSGYLFPTYMLLNAGVNPTTDITPVFAGKHDVSVQKVVEGTQCEAGFAEDSEVAKSDKVKVITKSMVPGAPIVMSSTLPTDVQQSLKDTLSKVTVDDMVTAGVTSANSAAFREVFYATSPVDDAYYNLIRSICEKTQAKQCKK